MIIYYNNVYMFAACACAYIVVVCGIFFKNIFQHCILCFKYHKFIKLLKTKLYHFTILYSLHIVYEV